MRAVFAALLGIGLVSVGVGFVVSSTAAVVPPTQTLWSNSAPAGAEVDSDPGSVELGTPFKASVSGTVVGVRFWKTAENKGTHVGNLWSSTGTNLATVTFTNETSSGWQTGTFAKPISIKAGQQYVISYHAPNGRYVATSQFTGTSNAASLSVQSGKSGVYAYGTKSSYPSLQWNSSQYWVDVIFRPSVAVATPPLATATPKPTQPAATGFPTRASVGVPTGWTPKRVITGDYWVKTAGTVVEDIRVNGVLYVDAPNVTVRRVEVVSGRIENQPRDACSDGLLIENSTVTRGTRRTSDTDPYAVGIGGYTARNVLLDGVPEGFRVGGKHEGCGPVVIENSYARIVAPDNCIDWHGDGVQGYEGPALTLRNSRLDLIERAGCAGTAPFFYPLNQGNTSVNIAGLIVDGGGYPFRLGMPGAVTGLRIVDKSWGYGAISVRCSGLATWEAQTVTLDTSGQPHSVHAQVCTGN
jgi:hypothetical protein